MKLSGLDIFRRLPGTNCKDCGMPTCMSFAMKVAGGKAEVRECPHLSEEARSFFEGLGSGRLAEFTIGTGPRAIKIGGETAVLRHEGRYINRTAIFVSLPARLQGEALERKLLSISRAHFERIGETLTPSGIAIIDDSFLPENFIEAARLAAEKQQLPLLLGSLHHQTLERALEKVADRKPLVYGGFIKNLPFTLELATRYRVPLAIRPSSFEELAKIHEIAVSKNIRELVIDFSSISPFETVQGLIEARRRAILGREAWCAYPTMAFAGQKDRRFELMEASLYILKYASLTVISSESASMLLPLLTLIQNIYSDPQKPAEVAPGLYTAGAATPSSPLYVTTNFSLTYHTLVNDIEASRVPAHILVIGTEGTSVLTAWAADKLNAETIAKAVLEFDLSSKISHRTMIIPGGIAPLKQPIEKATGWNVIIGPRTSSRLASFVRTLPEIMISNHPTSKKESGNSRSQNF